MKWFKVQAALILLVNSVELKCGEFSNEKTLNELPAIILDTKIGENVTIPLPKTDKNHVIFILTRPNGEQYLLNNLNYYNNINNYNNVSYSIEKLNTKDLRNKYITPIKTNDNDKEDKIENAKEITIGPITEEDFGNWATSACYIEKDIETEIFQVFSIHIEENIATVPKHTTSIHHHEDLKIRLTHPIPGLKTCELVAPKGSSDRSFQRDPEYVDSCGFILKDAGVADAGTWRVIAVGNIVYVGEMEVMILEDP